MRDKLTGLIGELQGAPDQVYLLKSLTLLEILKEMHGMCQPGQQNVPTRRPVIVEENKGRAGFTLSTPRTTGGDGEPPTNPYVMKHVIEAGVDTGAKTDEWDIVDGPTTDGSTPVADAETFDGVRYDGDEFRNGVLDPSLRTLDEQDSGGDTQEVSVMKMEFCTRKRTYNSSGQLTHIGPHVTQTIPDANAGTGGVNFVGWAEP